MRQVSLRMLFIVTFIVAMVFAIITHAWRPEEESPFVMLLLALIFGCGCVFCRELLEIKSEHAMVALATSVVSAFGFMVCSFSTAAPAACFVTFSAS